jgi:hypothetical protein
MHTVLCSTHREKCRRKYLYPAATFALVVRETDTTYSQAQYAMLLCRPVAEETRQVLVDVEGNPEDQG